MARQVVCGDQWERTKDLLPGKPGHWLWARGAGCGVFQIVGRDAVTLACAGVW